MDPYVEYTNPNLQFSFDLNKNRLFTRNQENFINRLGRDNLNTLGNVSLLDIYLSRGHVVEPHYHQNAAELVYATAGSAAVSLINPFTNQVTTVMISPGQVANIPQGWWHWEVALEDNTHLLAIFDAPFPEYIFGSDILTKTPIDVLAHTYCLDRELLSKALQPLNNETIIIGPTDQCVMQMHRSQQTAGYTQQSYEQQAYPSYSQQKPVVDFNTPYPVQGPMYR
ncbi:cupin domain-containing protein [Paenibacillus whitsoniae]|uniref:Cupin domain-containing protein n=1 Tax=Paenibacillus whitsoniae TaxID=2496558 RepID=A0A430J5A7_9BACL|nr:cupin domain-containing protein [Paenibacillus whitsoniae]RTE03016.1 cupin domain-containing protein [Paenibacillus whitsoniae]